MQLPFISFGHNKPVIGVDDFNFAHWQCPAVQNETSLVIIRFAIPIHSSHGLRQQQCQKFSKKLLNECDDSYSYLRYYCFCKSEIYQYQTIRQSLFSQNDVWKVLGISNVRCNIDSFKADLDLDLINLDFLTIVCRNQHAIKSRKEDPDLDNYKHRLALEKPSRYGSRTSCQQFLVTAAIKTLRHTISQLIKFK